MSTTSNVPAEEQPIEQCKQQGNMVTQKGHGSSPETKFKVMEDCDLNDREFKTAVIKK